MNSHQNKFVFSPIFFIVDPAGPDKFLGLEFSSKEMGFLNPNFPFFSESGGAV